MTAVLFRDENGNTLGEFELEDDLGREHVPAYASDSGIRESDTGTLLITLAYRPQAEETGTCRWCGRDIALEDGTWVDEDATGDDEVWRESCDQHDTFTAEHEPEDEARAFFEEHFQVIAVPVPGAGA